MKSPAFQFYPKDWLSSRGVRMMTSEQRGWYIQLLCEAWESEVQGTLPNDPKILWILAGASSEHLFNTCSTPVIAMFNQTGETLVHNRLVEEVIKQKQWSEHCSQAGKKSALKRKESLKNDHLEPIKSSSNTRSTPVMVSVEPKSNIASTSSTTIKSSNNKKESSISRSFTDEWCRAWEEHHGAKYSFRPADGVAVANLIKIEPDTSKIIEIAKKAWALNGRNDFERKHSIQLTSFVSQYNSIRLAVGDLQQKQGEKKWI